MADINPERLFIQQEETAADAAVSESTMSRVGAGINFINSYQANIWQFNVNGRYNIVPTPNNQVDGIVSFPFNWEIVYVYIYSGEAVGSSGTTTLDLKWATFTGTSFASIFSTTPKFTSSALPNQTCGNGQTKTGFTAPVLSKTTFDAYDKIRFDLLQAQVGAVKGAGIGLVYRPR